MNSAQVRQTFIDFFIEKGHTFAKGGPVVPQNDPTIMFTNAGMNQFKDVFLGTGTRPYTRAVNSQVCIRVSGKHNDLEDVGFDTTHLTLFEMLGNWSFGDYYKKEAIAWAWELLVDRFGLPADKVYATVYKTDDESEQLWKTVTPINPNHVLKFGEKDNFWEMGEVGPCGPCTELHLDRGPQACDKPNVPHTCEVNGVCARYIELWNLVFIQYNRMPGGTLENLPKTHVDTGAGLERLVAYLQGTSSNYETDLFLPLIKTLENASGKTYSDTVQGMPFRVMADHIRTLTFSIADNVMPSNEGRGYVLRRLLRRALKYSSQLGFKEPILYTLVPVVVATMGGHFTHLQARQSFIQEVVKAEEDLFLRTLQAGLGHFKALTQGLSKGAVIAGAEAFKLYDTFGFPLDLTQVLATENGFEVDLDGFETALQAQKDLSRKNRNQGGQGDEKVVVIKEDVTAIDLLEPKEPKLVPMGGEARIVSDKPQKVWMARHHTGTHLLQSALREALGEHVHQAGSLVDVDRLRFDFTHFSALSGDLVKAIEATINQKINEAIGLDTFYKPINEAKAMGAMALFGEKYDDEVRVVKIGDYSMELCIGTHVANTKALQAFKIVHESAVSSGVRRIEALLGFENIANHNAVEYQKWAERLRQKALKLNKNIDTQLEAAKTPQAQLALEEALALEFKQHEKQLHSEQSNQLQTLATDLELQFKTLKQFRVGLFFVEGLSMPQCRDLSDVLIQQKNTILCVVSSLGQVVVRLSSDIEHPSPELAATAILQFITSKWGGKGGGKTHMAQAGGVTVESWTELEAGVLEYLNRVG